MLCLTRTLGEKIVIGEGENAIVVEVVAIQYGRIRLGITAPKEIPIMREEVLRKLQGGTDQ